MGLPQGSLQEGGSLAMCQTVTLHLLQAFAGPTSGTISGMGLSCPSFDDGAVGKGHALWGGWEGHNAWMTPLLRIGKQR